MELMNSQESIRQDCISYCMVLNKNQSKTEKLHKEKNYYTEVALKIRVDYVIEQVEQFFRYELRSNEVFLLLGRAHCLELQLKIMQHDIEQFDYDSNAL